MQEAAVRRHRLAAGAKTATDGGGVGVVFVAVVAALAALAAPAAAAAVVIADVALLLLLCCWRLCVCFSFVLWTNETPERPRPSDPGLAASLVVRWMHAGLAIHLGPRPAEPMSPVQSCWGSSNGAYGRRHIQAA